MKIYTDKKLKDILTKEFHRLCESRQRFVDEMLTLRKEHQDSAHIEKLVEEYEAKIDYLSDLMHKLNLL